MNFLDKICSIMVMPYVIITPLFEVDEFIIKLNKELEATIVNQKEKMPKK